MANTTGHGKTGKGHRLGKKQLSKDLTRRLNQPQNRNRPLPMPDNILVVDMDNDRALWYWRRGQETWKSIEKKRGG